MEICRTCMFFEVECVCEVAANDNFDSLDHELIIVPSDLTLAKQSSVHRLAMAYRAKSLSRRSVLNYLADAFTSYQGIAVDAEGAFIEVHDLDVDDVFRTEADPSERWISDFLRAGVSMPKREAQDRVIPRLRLLWLALAITNRVQSELVVQ